MQSTKKQSKQIKIIIVLTKCSHRTAINNIFLVVWESLCVNNCFKALMVPSLPMDKQDLERLILSLEKRLSSTLVLLRGA